MTKTKFSDSILEKIKAQEVTQKSRWYFVFKNGLFWTIFSIAVLFGALGFSVILFSFFESDFDLFSFFNPHHQQIFWSLLPLFWFGFFTLFLGFSVWGIHATRKGYKLSILLLLGINIFSSMALGSVFYGFGGGEKLERIFDERAPFYEGLEHRMKRVWQNPDQGRLAGEILEIRSDETLLVFNSFQGKQWIVQYRDARIPKRELRVGMPIKILGKRGQNDLFLASEIRPFMPRRMDGRGMRNTERSFEGRKENQNHFELDRRKLRDEMRSSLFRKERSLYK